MVARNNPSKGTEYGVRARYRKAETAGRSGRDLEQSENKSCEHDTGIYTPDSVRSTPYSVHAKT